MEVFIISRKPDSKQTKEKIIDVSARLFAEKGYEQATMQDIVNESGMSKGAIFHHFESKEQIAEAVVTRICDGLLETARPIAADVSIPIVERFAKTVLALSARDADRKQMLIHLRGPHNAMIHMKMQAILIEEVTPIFAGILREGVEQGIFDTRYPDEVMEMVLCYTNSTYNDTRMARLDFAQISHMADAFVDCLERLTGAAPGSLSILGQLIVEVESNG
jgi:AcrR family transcriptional regulator